MNLLYPCDPFDKKQPDEVYADEYAAALAAGHTCHLFSADDLEIGEFRPRPALPTDQPVIYRGWMLTPAAYGELSAALARKGASLLTSTDHYQHCHYLPEWYGQCRDLTPRTVILAKDANFEAELAGLGWAAYFIKDYVKSLTTQRGSVAATTSDIKDIISQIEKFRGGIEGGICVREYEDLIPESEERYFIYQKMAFSRNGVVPDICHDIASRIDCPFYSADIVSDRQGRLRLIELGDGQVSDLKKWPASEFVNIF